MTCLRLSPSPPQRPPQMFSGTLWQGTSLTVPMAAGPSCTGVARARFCSSPWWGDDGAIGAFGATRMLSGWGLEIVIFWECYGAQCGVVGVGCSDSTITPSSSRTTVLAAG